MKKEICDGKDGKQCGYGYGSSYGYGGTRYGGYGYGGYRGR